VAPPRVSERKRDWEREKYREKEIGRERNTEREWCTLGVLKREALRGLKLPPHALLIAVVAEFLGLYLS